MTANKGDYLLLDRSVKEVQSRKRQAGIARWGVLALICIIVNVAGHMYGTAEASPIESETKIAIPNFGENISIGDGTVNIETHAPVQQNFMQFIHRESPEGRNNHKFILVRTNYRNAWICQWRQRKIEISRQWERKKFDGGVVSDIMSWRLPVIDHERMEFKWIHVPFVLPNHFSRNYREVGSQLTLGRIFGIGDQSFCGEPEQYREKDEKRLAKFKSDIENGDSVSLGTILTALSFLIISIVLFGKRGNFYSITSFSCGIIGFISLLCRWDITRLIF